MQGQEEMRMMSKGDYAPLFRFAQERPYIVAEVARRAYRAYLSDARQSEDSGIEYILNDAAYQEIERLTRERGPEDEIRATSCASSSRATLRTSPASSTRWSTR